jgi:hypothetical protein
VRHPHCVDSYIPILSPIFLFKSFTNWSNWNKRCSFWGMNLVCVYKHHADWFCFLKGEDIIQSATPTVYYCEFFVELAYLSKWLDSISTACVDACQFLSFSLHQFMRTGIEVCITSYLIGRRGSSPRVLFYLINLFSLLHYTAILHVLQLNIHNMVTYSYHLCIISSIFYR